MPHDPDDGILDDQSFDEDGELHAADIAIFVDEDGVEHAFGILAVVEAAGGEYALATPVEQLDRSEADDEAFELYVFRYTVDDDGTEHYEPVDDEAIFASVQAAAEHLIGFEAEKKPPMVFGGPLGEA